MATDREQTFASYRCRSGRHLFEPFTPSNDLGGGAQRCECGKLLIDRTLGGGRVVEINGPDYVGRSRSRVGRLFG